MKVNQDAWQVLCTSVQHKQHLLAYAAECGVKTVHPAWGHHDDADLYLSWFGTTIGVAALPVRYQPSRETMMISADLFKTMCQAYAEAEPQRTLLMST